MEGYIMNKSPKWKHALKRSVAPGSKIKLDELFEQYGVKYGLEDGPEFVAWLREVKLKDSNTWKIVLEENEKELSTETAKEVSKYDNVVPPVASKMSIGDITGLSVRRAREVVPKINDLTLLKYAMQEANQLSGKDSLCKIIRKRIREIQIAR